MKGRKIVEDKNRTKYKGKNKNKNLINMVDIYPIISINILYVNDLKIKLPTSAGSWKKQESSRKTSISMPKPLAVWITRNCGKF